MVQPFGNNLVTLAIALRQVKHEKADYKIVSYLLGDLKLYIPLIE
jgi:hypothetical protein